MVTMHWNWVAWKRTSEYYNFLLTFLAASYEFIYSLQYFYINARNKLFRRAVVQTVMTATKKYIFKNGFPKICIKRFWIKKTVKKIIIKVHRFKNTILGSQKYCFLVCYRRKRRRKTLNCIKAQHFLLMYQIIKKKILGFLWNVSGYFIWFVPYLFWRPSLIIDQARNSLYSGFGSGPGKPRKEMRFIKGTLKLLPVWCS